MCILHHISLCTLQAGLHLAQNVFTLNQPVWEIWPSHVLQYAHKCSVRTPASLCHCTRFALPVIATITPVSNWRQPIIRQITVTLLQYAPSIEDVLSDLSPRGVIQTSVTKEEPWGCCSCSVCLPLWPSPSGCSEHLHCS